MSDIEIAVNAWFREWLLTNNPDDFDFLDELEEKLPHLKFTWTGKEYILIN